MTSTETTLTPAPQVSDAAVEAALDSWFEETFRGTAAHIQEAVRASHRGRMRAAIETAVQKIAAEQRDEGTRA